MDWADIWEYMNNILKPYDKQLAEINKAIKAINDKLWELENRVEELEKEVGNLSGSLYDRGVIG